MIRAAILTVAVCISPCFAQDGPPNLEPVFSDDFSTDTRADYKVTGDVSWESGQLTLNRGASIARAIEGGTWARVELVLEPVGLTTEQPHSELRVWFILDGTTNCYVLLRRELKGGQTTGSVALVDTGEQDGKPIERVVRQAALRGQNHARLSIEYRNGLVTVTAASETALVAYIEKGNATVTVTRLTATAASRLKMLRVATRRDVVRELNAQEQQHLADARDANGKSLRLYRQGKFAEAAKIGEEVLAIRKSVLGEQHPSYATSLNNLAQSYHRMGDFVRAEPLFKQAIDIRKSALGEKHPHYATGLNNLALLYRSMGDYARAEPLYIQAIEINKSVLGEQHPHYATTLNNLGAMYRSTGDYARAEPLYRQATDIRRSVLGEQHPDYALSLNNLALLYQSMGDYGRAEPLYGQAIEIRKSVLGEQHPSYATNLDNLAGLYKSMGDYARAEPLYRQTIEIKKSVLGEHHPSYATSLNNLASLYRSRGDFARAEPLLRQASGIWKSVFGEQHPDYATSLNNLALLYVRMGDYARAEPLSRQAIHIRKSVLGEQHPHYANSLNNLALLYNSMGDYARAEPLYKQARDLRKSVLGAQHPAYATSLHNLAALYWEMRDYKRAEPLYKQARDLRKSVLGEQHPSYATSLDSLAVLYKNMGDYARAESLSRQATALRKSLLGEQHPDYAASLHNLALLYHSMGDYARAERLSRQAATLRKSVLGEQHPDYAASLQNLALLYHRMGDYARAESLCGQAMNIARKNLDGNSLVQSERQQKQNQTGKRSVLDDRLTLARRSRMKSDELLRAYWQWKGAVTLRQQAYRRVAANPTLRPLFEKLRSISGQLSAISNRAPAPPPTSAPEAVHKAWRVNREDWGNRLAALTRTREDLEQKIATASIEFRRVREPLTVAAVQRVLPSATAFVDILEYKHFTPDPEKNGQWNAERRYIAFVVRSDRPSEMVRLGSATSLSAAITAFRRPLAGEADNLQAATESAATLRETLWLPLEQHLDGITTVVLSPDTALGTLPLGALPGKEPGSYLIEQYRFASLPLAGMMRPMFDENAQRRQPEKGLLVLGDVNYDANAEVAQALPETDSRPAWMRGSAPRSGESGWKSLPGFQQELVIVRDHFEKKFGGGVTTLRGDEATEAAFIEQASRHYNLHLVTHGFFANPEFEAVGSAAANEDRTGPSSRRQLAGNKAIQEYMPGLLSGIVLAGANTPAPNSDSDGILTASEIETLDLGAVDLVVLSACETGLGKTAGGEGLTGLQRAFHIAGARSCIATLWKVDDRATQELMSRFYRNYWEKGQSKIDALRNAQLDLLRNPELTRGESRRRDKPAEDAVKKERTDPRYWAAFVLSGDWR